MKVSERRKEIVNLLSSSKEPVSGGQLSERFDVSRQIIVQDIAVLKGAGYEILSTHNGYLIQKTPLAERVFKLKHTTEQTEDELNCIVDFGGTVVDVFVWHKIYGKISATLNICSRLQVKQFLEGVRTGKSTELMNVTGGYHYHTIRASTEEILDKIGAALLEKNYIADGD
ncbi:MAG: transcription repressor NadR [Clostridiales bacterium]|nr:transcription repressor NadR [Clostridiales bacterium]